MALQRIGIVGAGAWGTALALALLRAGRRVLLLPRRAAQANAIALARENRRYLPGVTLPPEITVSAEPEALAECGALLLAAPAQHLRATLQDLAAAVPDKAALVIGAKGIELGSGKLLDAVVAETLPGRPLAVLSGPAFAAEVAAGLPTALTLAAKDAVLAQALVQALGSATFRPYAGDDPTGALVGGALKNVIAIACGLVEGRQLGENARAALVTRGLAEMARLGRALGGKPGTFAGLSGLGDLVLTAGSRRSRNTSLGIALGEGRQLEEVLGERVTVAEGVATAAAVAALADSLGIEMPIATAVNRVLHEAAPLEDEIGALLARPFKQEAL